MLFLTAAVISKTLGLETVMPDLIQLTALPKILHSIYLPNSKCFSSKPNVFAIGGVDMLKSLIV